MDVDNIVAGPTTSPDADWVGGLECSDSSETEPKT